LRAEKRLRVFENTVLRETFWLKDEVTGDCITRSCILIRYYSGDQIKKNGMRVGHVAYIRERKRAYRVLVGKTELKRQIGRPRHGWESNIKKDLQEIRWEGVDLIDLVQDWDRWRAG
jgi:hypothetical protein